MGRLTTPTRNVLPDINMRAGQCFEKLKPVIGKCFQAKGVDVADKITIVRCYFFAILFAGASNWPTLSAAGRDKLHTYVMKLWRTALALHYMDLVSRGMPHLSDQQLIDRYKIFSPETMLALMRINLFIRVVLKASHSLKGAILAAHPAPKSWLRAVESDLKHMQAFIPEYRQISSTTEWIAMIQADPAAARRNFKKAASQPCANQLTSEPLTSTGASVGERLFCRFCNHSCHDAAARASHEHRVHGVKRIARHYMGPSQTCRVCMKRYQNRDLAVRHLTSRSQKCLTVLKKCLPPFAKEDSELWDQYALDEVKLKPKGVKNVVVQKRVAARVQGPLRVFDDDDELLSNFLDRHVMAGSDGEFLPQLLEHMEQGD